MLILLPPSEGKTAPEGDRPFRLDSLAFADRLRQPRETLLRELVKLCEGPVEAAVETLGISDGQVGEVAVNAGLREAPAGPAADVYTGVLFEHLGFGTLTPEAKVRTEAEVLISSGLWGFIRPGDRIPRYRFSMKPKLDRIGGLAAFWREPLREAMTEAGHDRDGEFVLDLRSGAYAAAWKPKEARLIAVRGFTETAAGRKSISHMAKAIRGDVARIALEADHPPGDPEALAGLLEATGLNVELTGKSIDVIVS